MKNIFKTGTLLSALFLVVACEKDQEQAVLNSDAKISTTLSTSSLVLSKDNADQTALTVSWETSNMNVNLAQTYSIVLESNGKSNEISVTSSPYSFTNAELNKILLNNLELTAGTESQVGVTVQNAISDLYDIISATQTLTVTPYADLIEPTEWGVVGSITEWGNTGIADIPFWKVIGSSTQYVAYFTVASNGSEIKFRKNSSWSENYGDDGANGTLEASGANIAINAGTYRVLWDISANTYTIENYAWGIVGGAANGWDESNTDIPLSYDGTIDSWVAKDVVLKDGDIKFRFNNKWNGSDKGGATNALKGSLGGENITVTAGTYTITVNFTDGTYSIVAQ